MGWIVHNLWLVPAMPVLAGGIIALTRQKHRVLAASLAIGSMSISLVLAINALIYTVHLGRGAAAREVVNLNWFQFGSEWVKLGWILDPLTAVMLVMVTFVGLLIFIYSVGYMADDANFTRFFGFLSLFAGAMLGVLISNSLLTLFMCWEVVGLTSYLLIGFWYERPSAAAAAKKAFIVTRIGDLGLFLGMVWLYGATGTLLFYDSGRGCMESTALAGLVSHGTAIGMTAATVISLLIFCGAAGKSGQFPLHVWLPDAMEGPTPVSALIHAATMVAAGVFLVARIYPLMSATGGATSVHQYTAALGVVTWVGAVTALFGSLVAVAQWDIKRILAYSTVSQLGYMMIGIGTGGVAVGMFHLITHAFFKALLFLGAGSVIHGCAGEQDIRRMGGLRRTMPWTFLAYTCGMLALSGFPLFSGFWSKDEILHAAFVWNPSHIPFLLGAIGALLTAFYMTRQIYYVYTGSLRGTGVNEHENAAEDHGHTRTAIHESPMIMTVPLLILAVFAVLLGFIGTAAWPWFQAFLEGTSLGFRINALSDELPLMLVSTCIVFSGLGLGWILYGRQQVSASDGSDPLEATSHSLFALLNGAFYINELYSVTLVRLTRLSAVAASWIDEVILGGAVHLISEGVIRTAKLDETVDRQVVNRGFDVTCSSVGTGAKGISALETGRAQGYLATLGIALIVVTVLLIWGGKA